MKKFLFKKKKENRMIMYFASILLGLIVLYSLQIERDLIPHSVVYLIVSTISLISILKSVKKARKEVKEITYEDNIFHFVFFNKMSDKLKVNERDIKTEIKDNRVVFSVKTKNKSIGISYLDNLIDSSKKKELNELLSNKTTCQGVVYAQNRHKGASIGI